MVNYRETLSLGPQRYVSFSLEGPQGVAQTTSGGSEFQNSSARKEQAHLWSFAPYYATNL